jgi:N-acetylneuraminic acid mutarotase
MKKTLSALILFFIPYILNAQQAVWKAKTFPGTAAYEAMAFSIGDKIFLGGGYTYPYPRSFFEFDETSNTWMQQADIPGVQGSRSGAIAFSIDGKGYIGLGEDSALAREALRDLWEFDTSNNTWTQKADFPGGSRFGAYAFVINGIAYVGGGYDTGYHTQSDLYSYDPSSDSWHQLSKPFFGSRTFAATFAIGNYGYVATGLDTNSQETADLWRYNPSNDSWNPLALFPNTARQGSAGFSFQGSGYLALGRNAADVKWFNGLFGYDPATDTWDTAGNTPNSIGFDGAIGVATNDHAYIGLGVDSLEIPSNLFWEITLPQSSVFSASSPATDAVVYPNPATHGITIGLADFSGTTPVILELYSMAGQQIQRQVISSGSTSHNWTVDLSNYPPGDYFLRASDGKRSKEWNVVKK